MMCNEIRELSSSYLDRALAGAEMRRVGDHLAQCGDCAAEYSRLQKSQQLVASLGRKPAPQDLSLRIRVALSQEIAGSRRPWYQGFQVRLQNSLNAFMFPATAGVISAVLFFGLLIGYFAAPGQVGGDDVPLVLYTPPQLAASPFSANLGAAADVVVVETYVDAEGRVQDYKVLSAPENSEKLLQQVDNMMIFTTFRPATAFGRPTPGRVVLSFSKINVKG